MTNLPHGWRIKRLGDCILKAPEYGANSPSVEHSEDLPRYVRITDIDNFGNLDKEKVVSVELEGNEKYILADGDFLFARSGATVGKTYLYDPRDGKAIFAGYLIRVRTNPKTLLPKYLKGFTQTHRYWFWVKSTLRAGAQPNINAKEYASLPIPLPPLPEQHVIAEILSTWDEAIAKTEQLIAALQKRKKGLMQRLLTGEVRFPGFITSKKSRFAFGKEMPEDWEIVEFGDFAQRENAKFNPKKVKKVLPCIELEHLSQETGKILGCIPSSQQRSTKSIFNSGQVLFGKLRPYLRKYAQPDFDGVCSSEIWVLNGRKEICRNDYLFYLVQSSRFLNVSNVTSGTKMPRSSWDYVSKSTFGLPPVEEQRTIASTLQACDREVDLHLRKLEALQEQKKGLMQRLLTGEVRVRVN